MGFNSGFKGLNLCNWHLQQNTDRKKHYCIYDTSYSSRIQSPQATKPQICASTLQVERAITSMKTLL